MSLQIGSLAPNFDLECVDSPGGPVRRVRLSDFQGRWLILIFYPRDFSLVCPTELAGLSRRAGEFSRQGRDLLGISCDPIQTHEKWIATPLDRGGLEGLAFPLASDTDGACARAYNVYLELQRVALRGLFIIDPNGVLQFQVVHNLSVGRRADDVKRVLDRDPDRRPLCGELGKARRCLDPRQMLRPDTVVSHYRIQKLVGSGSFANVYLARDLTLDRSVALKVFKPGGPITAATVLAEARSAAALNHPNVCTIFGVDDSLGVPTIAMEYVHGRSLSKIIADGAISPAQAASIGRQIAAGIAEAHARGVVHGDVKPENIMVGEDGVVKILDFGLAKRSRTASTGDTVTLGLAEGSDSAGIFGTPSYLAPEQTRRARHRGQRRVAPGVTFHELLTGRKSLHRRRPARRARQDPQGRARQPRPGSPRALRDHPPLQPAQRTPPPRSEHG